jgi:hypothetical protein
MTKTVNRHAALKVAVAYPAECGGAKAFAFNLFGNTPATVPTKVTTASLA